MNINLIFLAGIFYTISMMKWHAYLAYELEEFTTPKII